MLEQNNFSVCYVLGEKENTVTQSDGVLQIVPKENSVRKGREITLQIKNCTDKRLMLKYAVLWEGREPEQFDIGEGPYEVYRSGRHKNDMPGTFTLGIADERMFDVLGAMTESGDKLEGEAEDRTVVSDHLTVIKGKKQSLLIMFMGGRKQLFETDLLLDKSYQCKKICAKVIFNIVLLPGQMVETETLRLVYSEYVEEEIERFAVDKAQQFGTRCGKHPSVFCTWYYYGLTVTYEDVKTNLSIMEKRKLPFDVFQIDEGWEITLGEWQPNEKFPVEMKQIATEIKEAGYRAGIWTSPFIAHETAGIWKEHPEWCLKDREGKPCLFPMNDTVYWVFDITNPATHAYFKELYQRLTFEWGYTYHKLDFTRAAVIYEVADFFDKSITLAEAYYKAVRAIREGMGEDAYFLMCGGLYDPIIGLVDAQRTGSDVLSMWSSNINKGGKTAPYTIKQSTMRYYMNAWWDNDPDALMIRKNATMERGLRLTYGLLTEEEVKTSVMNQFMGGGIMCATEPLDKITDDRLMEYQRILPVISGKVRPIDLMDSVRFPKMMDVYREKEAAHYLCMVNWEDEKALAVELCIESLLPDFAHAGDTYMICDYYNGDFVTDIAAGDKVSFQEIAPHGAGLFKVVKQEKRPMVVCSTGHFSLGGEIECLEMQGDVLHYVITNYFDKVVHYTVLLPNGKLVVLDIEKGRQEGNVYDGKVYDGK